MEVFAEATRRKLRFNEYKGVLSVEDVWDLSLKELDVIYKKVSVCIKEDEQQDSLFEETKEIDKDLTLKYEVVKQIFKVKLEEKKLRESEKYRSEKKKRLLEILAQKQDAALFDKSVEELRQLIDNV
jgi:gamma-glutamylcysteine synthetase